MFRILDCLKIALDQSENLLHRRHVRIPYNIQHERLPAIFIALFQVLACVNINYEWLKCNSGRYFS